MPFVVPSPAPAERIALRDGVGFAGWYPMKRPNDLTRDDLPTVVCRDGLRGKVLDPDALVVGRAPGEAVAAGGDPVRVRVALDGGRQILVRADALERRADGSFFLPVCESDLRNEVVSQPDQSVVVPVVAEALRIEKREVERGRATVQVVPRERTERVDVELAEEAVEIERVPVNRFVTAPEPPREEGDVTIVPVYEEVLVVERRLMVKEEIRIRRHRTTRRERHDVTLREEEVRVLRAGEDGTRPAETQR